MAIATGTRELKRVGENKRRSMHQHSYGIQYTASLAAIRTKKAVSEKKKHMIPDNN